MSSMQLSGFGRGSGVSMGSMSDIMLTCPCSKTGVYRGIFIGYAPKRVTTEYKS